MPVEAVVAFSALVASLLSGLLGIGGGLVLTPLALYGPPLVGAGALSVKIVTGLTVVQATSGSVFGVIRHRRYGNVSTRLVRLMGPTAAAASLAGALVSRDAPDRLLLAIFAVFSLLGAIALAIPIETQDAPVHELEVNVPLAVALAAVIGFFGGMVGIGAIAFIIAALVYLLRIPPRVAVGTSLGVGFFSAVAALVGKAATAQIDPALGAIVVLGALVASPIGAAISQRTRPRVLLGTLSVVLVLTAARIGAQAIAGV